MTLATPPTSSSVSAQPADPTRGSRKVLLVLVTWFAVATALGASGVLPTLPRLAVPALIWSTLLGCLALYRRSSDVRAALERVPLGVPLACHALVRTGFGFAIIAEGQRGGVPQTFAEVAGPGDVLVGVLALVALPLASRPTAATRTLLLSWNALALVDILVAVALGQRELLFGRGPSSFAAVAHFPFAWLPTFVVPLVLSTHLWMFARLRTSTEARLRASPNGDRPIEL